MARKRRKQNQPEEPNFVEIAEKIYEQLKPLSAFIRTEVVYHLHRMVDDEPVDPEIEKAWIAELKRRVDDVDSGRDKGIPGEVVMAEVRRNLNSIGRARKSKRATRSVKPGRAKKAD